MARLEFVPIHQLRHQQPQDRDGRSGWRVRYEQLRRGIAAHLDAASQQISMQDANGNLFTTVFDVAGRVSASVDSLGYAMTPVYDAASRQVVYQDASGNLSTTVFGAAGRAQASVSALNNRTSFVYDVASQQIGIKDALNNMWTSVYDAAGRRQA